MAVPCAGTDYYVPAVYSNSTGSTAALLDASGDTSLTHSVVTTAPANSLYRLADGQMLIASKNSTAVAGWEPLSDRFDEGTLQALPAAS